METHLPPDFKEFLRLLNENDVKYLLIGGYAVGYHGYPRATNDMDIWIAPYPVNVTKVVTALRQFGFNTPELSESLFMEEKKIVRMGIPPMRIEVAVSIFLESTLRVMVNFVVNPPQSPAGVGATSTAATGFGWRESSQTRRAQAAASSNSE